MALDLERLRADESWNSPNVSTWAEKVRAALADHEGRITTSFKGLYNQVTNQIAGSPGGPLQPANTHLTGDYYTLEVNGVFSTPISELNGQTGGVGDQVISDGTQWLIFSPSTAFLSSQVDDTAAGVITFTPAPVSSAAASAANELIRKGESDAGDNAVQGNLDTHVGHTASADDVHQTKTYTDAQDAAHAALLTATDDVHQSKTYTDSTVETRCKGWNSSTPRDWVPTDGAAGDQWVGDGDDHPRGIAIGTPTGDPNARGVQGVLQERASSPGSSGGLALVGYADQSTKITDPGTLANAPVEISGQPVYVMGSLLLEAQTPVINDHYLIVGHSHQLADGRHVVPVLLGPQYNPTHTETASDTRDVSLDGVGTLEVIVTLGPLGNSYGAGISTFNYEALLAELGGRTAHFDVEIWTNIGGAGYAFQHRDEYSITGSTQVVTYSTPIPFALSPGDSIQMRVSAITTHPSSDPWVLGATRPSTLTVRQG